jgi:hypothetical protein
VNRHRAGCCQGNDRAADGELCDQSTTDDRADARTTSRSCARADGSGARRCPGRGDPRPAGAGSSDARRSNRVRRSVAEDRRREAGAGQHRQYRPERLALRAHRELEVTAADAQLQMSAQRTAPKFATMRYRELFANVLTGCAHRVAVSDQSGACLVDQRLDLAHLAPHDRGDRLVRQVVELGQQQR